jgi:cell division protein FtsL
MPFVLLVLALLGGGLICLLVINTTLGATSFRITQLQTTGSNLSTQEQSLQQQVNSEKAPAEIAKEAYQLGMRAQTNENILDLRTHRYYELPGEAGATVQAGAPGQDGVTGRAGSGR